MNTLAAPERTIDQRKRALDHANEVRVARSVLKRALMAGDIDPADVIADPPAYAAKMRLRDLLLAVPKLGPWRAGVHMATARIASSKTLGGLSDRQRHEIIRCLEAQ